jgi:hypothetical protein
VFQSNGHPYTQRVRVHPAHEREHAAPLRGGFDGELRCYLRDGSRTVAVIPILIDDHGNPSDLVWTPSSVETFDRLLFVYEGRTFTARLLEPQIVRTGQAVRLALAHLELVDRFGVDLLKGH